MQWFNFKLQDTNGCPRARIELPKDLPDEALVAIKARDNRFVDAYAETIFATAPDDWSHLASQAQLMIPRAGKTTMFLNIGTSCLKV